jgi:hypothetical protein
MEGVYSSRTLVKFCPATQFHIREDMTLQLEISLFFYPGFRVGLGWYLGSEWSIVPGKRCEAFGLMRMTEET